MRICICRISSKVFLLLLGALFFQILNWALFFLFAWSSILLLLKSLGSEGLTKRKINSGHTQQFLWWREYCISYPISQIDLVQLFLLKTDLKYGPYQTVSEERKCSRRTLRLVKAATAKGAKFYKSTISLNTSFFLKVWLSGGGGDSV